MELLVNVNNQKLRLATNLKSLVAGSQQFIKFTFNLSDEWDDLLTFAQFIQGSNSYNAYLDENNSVYLPHEIEAGTCKLILYGTGNQGEGSQIIATTNYLELNIDENITVANASSTEISQSLYEQLVEKFNRIADLSDSDYSDLIVQQVGEIMAGYLSNGDLAAATIQNGSIDREKVDSDFESTLVKADTAMQPSVYDTLNRATDVYDFATTQDNLIKSRVDSIENNINATQFIFPDQTPQYTITARGTITFPSLRDTVNGAYYFGKIYTDGAITSALDQYQAFTVQIVSTLPQNPSERTFYLIPKDSGNGYDKWWWIQDNEGYWKWDNFGSTSTVVVNESDLPVVGDVDTDYIVAVYGGYVYKKYIDNQWVIIAGAMARVLTKSEFDNLPSGDNLTDYYVPNDDGVYLHYRWINDRFELVGSDSYSKSEADNIVSNLQSALNSQLNTINGRIDNVEAAQNTLGNLVADVSENTTDGGIIISYKDGSSRSVATKDVSIAVADVKKSENGIKINYSNGDSEEIEISGGSGSGESSGSASIVRITESSTQCVYGQSCPISYTFNAIDSAGDMVGDGNATWYVGGIQKASSTASQGDNTFDIGQYLSAGSNTVKLSISVDTGGDTPKVVTKTWSINAINMYLVWDYEDTTINESDTVAIRWTPYGDISKTTHIIIDGEEYTTSTTTRSGVQQYISINKLSHGSHLVELYCTATVKGITITSDVVYHDMIFVDSANSTPIISSSIKESAMMQYDTLRIPVVIYSPNSLTSQATLAVDGETIATWNDVDRTVHYWNYTPNTYGRKTLTITSGLASKTLIVNVSKLDINNEEVSGYTFRLKASDLTSNKDLREWSSNGINASFSDNFDWNNGGVQTETDENGYIRQYICVKAGTKMTINHKLFSDDPTVYGKTFKVIFKVKNVRNYDTQIASCFADNIGLRMYAHESKFSSRGTSVSVPYGEDEYIELEFDIYPAPTETNGSHRYIMAWADGVITTCRVYGADDNFTQGNANQQNIVIGSDDCDVYVYMVKAYPNYMTRDNHIVNFISDAPNAQEMVKRYNRNDILNASDKIDYEKLRDNNPDLRIYLYDIPYLTNGKKDKVKNCTFNQFWKNGDNYYRLSGTGTMTVQGTSSVKYIKGAANTDFNFDTLTDGNGKNLLLNGVVDEDKYGKNYFVGNPETGDVTVFDVDSKTVLTPDCVAVERDENRNVTKYIKALGYKVNDDSCPISYSNTKVNFASCEQVNNMCNAIWYQRFNPYPSLTPRDCMEFSMGVQFIKDSGTIPDDSHFVLWGDNDYHMYSIANMGTSKKNVHLFHDLSNPNEVCIEINDNNAEQMRMVNDDLSAEDWSGDVYFGMRYPDTKNPSQKIKDAWQRVVTWMASNNPNAATGNALPQPETYDVYTFKGHDRKGTQVLKGTTVKKYAGTYTHDTFNRRMAKMLSECEDYLVMDSFVYHFVYQERHTMVDNVAKNTFWSSTDLVHWDMSKAYDMDTSDGNNNQGQMVFDYGNEYNDDIGGMKVFNAADSVWFVFIANLYEACQTMFINRESEGAWSAAAYHNFFLNEQRKVPERCWVECYWYDYLRTYEQGISEEWMTFLDGGQKTHQRNHYEYFEEMYDSSKYRGTASTSQNINFRAYTPNTWEGVEPKSELTVTMYNKMYLSMDVGTTALEPIKLERGVPYTVDFSSAGMLNNTLIAINTASMIQSISGMEQLYPDTCVFSMASRLRELTIGSTKTGYQNTFLKSLSLTNNTMLEKLYVQNLPNANVVLDVSNCPALSYLDASGSSFTGYNFAVGGLLSTAYIESPTSLTLRNLYYITNDNFHVTSYANLDTVRIENCSGIDSLAIVNSAASLARARLLNIDWSIAETDILNRLYQIGGMNENGNNTPISVLTGKAYISGQVRNQELLNYENAWANLEVTYNSANLITQYLATYVNPDGTILYQTYVDQGAIPPDPVTLGYISTPTQTATAQYTFTYSGWDDITSAMLGARTITAQYSQTTRTYTVTWYSREGLSLGSTQANYGSEVVYNGDLPTDTSGEAQYIYKVFTGWNKSTGYITEDTDVYAVWETASTLPSTSKDLSNMTCAEIYGVCQAGKAADYFSDKDHFDITLGSDFNFENVESEVLLENRFFDGTQYVDTSIKLFDENAPSFTLAVDYEFLDSTANNGCLVSNCVNNDGEGFKLQYNTNPSLKWGDKTVVVGTSVNRNIVVLRHIKGSNTMFVYTYNKGDTTYDLAITRTESVRSSKTETSQVLTFGGIRNVDGTEHGFYGKGWIYWAKIWYDDLGDNVARKLSSWIRETLRMEYIGENRYLLPNSMSKFANASFLANNALPLLKRMNSTNDNTGGWSESEMRTFLNTRIYEALPYKWQSVIKQVSVKSSAGGTSYSITTSNDKLYLAANREVGGSTNSPYVDEVDVTTTIGYFTNDRKRLKFCGVIIRDDAQYIVESTEPTLLTSYTVSEGDIWVNTNNQNVGYIYMSADTIAKHTRIGYRAISSTDNIQANDGGCWVRANNWWERSPYASHSTYFMNVTIGGGPGNTGASGGSGVALGFSI